VALDEEPNHTGAVMRALMFSLRSQNEILATQVPSPLPDLPAARFDSLTPLP
jgi:hypothetical protein